MDPSRRAALTDSMRRLADGDRSVMPEIIRAVTPPVRALCERMLGSLASPTAEANDVVQEVVIDLFRRAPDFDRDGDALSWALTIAAWHCRTERRRRSRSRTSPMLDEPADAAIGAEEALDDRRLASALEEATLGLGDKDREVLAAILAGAPLDAALRKRKERMIVKLRRLLLGDAS